MEEQTVTIITSSAEAGTAETMPVAPEMKLMTTEELLRSGRHFSGDENVCMTSENSLEALSGRLDPIRRKALETLKDKLLFREILRDLYPRFSFRLVNAVEIASLTIERKSVIKPRRGIFGTAVRVVTPGADMQRLSREIDEEVKRNARVYAQSVLSAEEFIMEDFLEGDEYAVDLFYDSRGKPCIVNITHHPVPVDTAYIHMMYNTSKKAFDRIYPELQKFFTRLNDILKVTRFPMHAEVQVCGDEIVPVEINPMRFGGMGLGNLVYYAHGINPFLCFSRDHEPEWQKIWEGKEEKIYTYFIAYNGKNIHPDRSRPRYDKLKSHFTRVIREQPFDHKKQLAFGIYFLEETEENLRELLKLDFNEFFEEDRQMFEMDR